MKKLLLKIGVISSMVTPVVFIVSYSKNKDDFDLSFLRRCHKKDGVKIYFYIQIHKSLLWALWICIFVY